MRFAGNFNPEWGYLAPAPSFIRTVRIAVVAAAVGGTAGAAVVFSLADRPAAEESVAARTLARPVDFAPARTPSQAVQLQVPTAASAQAQAVAARQGQSAMLSPANAVAVSSFGKRIWCKFDNSAPGQYCGACRSPGRDRRRATAGGRANARCTAIAKEAGQEAPQCPAPRGGLWRREGAAGASACVQRPRRDRLLLAV